jgi:hypothetical protein
MALFYGGWRWLRAASGAVHCRCIWRWPAARCGFHCSGQIISWAAGKLIGQKSVAVGVLVGALACWLMGLLWLDDMPIGSRHASASPGNDHRFAPTSEW